MRSSEGARVDTEGQDAGAHQSGPVPSLSGEMSRLTTYRKGVVPNIFYRVRWKQLKSSLQVRSSLATLIGARAHTM